MPRKQQRARRGQRVSSRRRFAPPIARLSKVLMHNAMTVLMGPAIDALWQNKSKRPRYLRYWCQFLMTSSLPSRRHFFIASFITLLRLHRPGIVFIHTMMRRRLIFSPYMSRAITISYARLRGRRIDACSSRDAGSLHSQRSRAVAAFAVSYARVRRLPSRARQDISRRSR